MKIKSPLTRELFNIDTAAGKVSFIALFFPILFQNLMATVLGTVNTAVISGFSENAAAAIGATSPVISMLTIIETVVSLGATVIISNNIGAKNMRGAEEVSYTGILVSIMLAILLTPLAFIFASPFMEMQKLSGEIFEIAVSYFRIRIIFFAAQIVNSYFLAVLRCYGHSKYTFFSGIISNVLNLVVSLVAVNIPSQTPLGAAQIMAVGCGGAGTVSLVYVLFMVKRNNVRFSKTNALSDFFMHLGSIMKIGIPSAISSMSFTLSQIVTTSFVATIGDYALVAKVIFTQILTYAYMFSISAGNANAVLIGTRYGAKEYGKMNRMNRELSRITIVVNLIISLSILLLRAPILSAFTENELIVSISLGVFAVDILTEQGRAISQVYEYALRAIGDVWVSLVALVISCWVFGIGLSYLCAVYLNMGLIGCYIGLAADECFRALFTYIRWKVVMRRLTKQNYGGSSCGDLTAAI